MRCETYGILISIVATLGLAACHDASNDTAPVVKESADRKPGDIYAAGQPECWGVGATIPFDFDSAAIGEEWRPTLAQLAPVLKRHIKDVFTIAGNADERGTREYNLALGQRRASAMRDYLIALGVSPDSLTTISYGKERPHRLGHDEESWAYNRSAEIIQPSGKLDETLFWELCEEQQRPRNR